MKHKHKIEMEQRWLDKRAHVSEHVLAQREETDRPSPAWVKVSQTLGVLPSSFAAPSTYYTHTIFGTHL